MYSPKISPDQVRRLYLLRESYVTIGIKKPMTVIVKEALDKYVLEQGNAILKAGGTLLRSDEILEDDRQGD